MADQDVRSLLLQIDANTQLLRSNLAAADAAVAKFHGDTQRHLDGVDGRFDRLGKSVKGLRSVFAVTAIGIAGLVTAAAGGSMIALAKSGLEYASSLGEVAQQLGVTTRDLQVFRFAATQVGISQEEMDKGLSKLTQTMGKAEAGAKAPIAAFNALGISVASLKGQTAGEVISRIADALAKIESPAQRAAIEMALFGKAGQKLDTLLAGGSGQIDELADAAERLGLVLSDDQIQRADDTADKLAAMKKVLEANIASVVADNAQSILDLANALASLVVWAGKATTAWRVFILSQQAQIAEKVRDSWFSTPETKLKAAQLASDLRDQINTIVNPPPTKSGKPAVRPSGGSDIPQFLATPDHSAEKAAREAERRRKEALRAEDRYQSELSRGQVEMLNLNSDLTSDYIERNKNSREANEIERVRRNASYDLDDKLTDAQRTRLKAISDEVAMLQDRKINREEDAQLEADALDLTRAGIANARDMEQARGRLAVTSADQLASQLRLLDLQYAEERAQLETVLHSQASTPIEKQIAEARLKILAGLQASDEAGVRRQNAGPGGRLLQDLDPEKINDQIEQIKVDGLKGLEDGLVGIMDGTKSVSAAFKDMAQSIISDLARIAIQQMIIKPLAGALFGGLGFADGGKVPGFATGGAISGPGGPRSDSILAAVSNGEFIVNAAATSRNLALLQAINDNKVPRFASGGLVSPSLAMPRLPDLRGVGGGAQGGGGPAVHNHFHITGAVMTQDLIDQMNAIGQAAVVGGAGMAQARMTRAAGRRLGS